MLRSFCPAASRSRFSCENCLGTDDRANLQHAGDGFCVNARDAMDGKGVLSHDRFKAMAEYGSGVPRLPYIYQGRLGRNAGDRCRLRHGAGNRSDTIFEPFSLPPRKSAKSTGMGMAVLHGIIKSGAGHILIDTAPGQGTTFRLLFHQLVDAASKPTTAIESCICKPDMARGAGMCWWWMMSCSWRSTWANR